jgi:hypothetical protein
MGIDIRIVSRDSIGLGSGDPFEGFVRVADSVSQTIGGESIRRLPNTVMEEISGILQEKVVSDTKSGTDVYGQPFQELSPKYRKRKIKSGMGGKANLYAKSTTEGAALDNMYFRRDGQSNTVEAGFDSNRQATYMQAHQEGALPYPKRQFFPEGQSINNPNYSEVNARIEDIVNQHILERIMRAQRG